MAARKRAGDGAVILQITDPHVTREGRKAFRVVDTAERLAETVEAIVAWEKKQGAADAIVVTGDLAQFAREEEYARFRAAMAPLEGRYRVMPGNHDSRRAIRAAFPDHAYLPKRGPLDWRMEAGPVILLGLDSLVEGSACGLLGADSLGWLVEQLAEAGERPVIAAIHHPPFESGIEDIDRDGLENAEEVLAALATHRGPLQVIAGHTHRSLTAAGCAGRGKSKAIPGAPLSAPPCFAALVRNYRPHAAQAYDAAPGGFMVHRYAPGEGFASTLIEVGKMTGELPRLS